MFERSCLACLVVVLSACVAAGLPKLPDEPDTPADTSPDTNPDTPPDETGQRDTDRSPSQDARPGPDDQPATDPIPALIDHPHPLITEVLFAVPRGRAGDASKDGQRHSAGDEFVELINPHDKAINLKGYTLRDKNDENQGRFTFTFPSCKVEPGGFVVVFNGQKTQIAGAQQGMVGTSTRAGKPNEHFSGALVFDAQASSSRVALANSADYVALLTPSGTTVQCVYWGDEDEIGLPDSEDALLEEADRVSGGSVSRRHAADAIAPHPTVEGVSFSPGTFTGGE